jgi:hypothetical protein
MYSRSLGETQQQRAEGAKHTKVGKREREKDVEAEGEPSKAPEEEGGQGEEGGEVRVDRCGGEDTRGPEESEGEANKEKGNSGGETEHSGEVGGDVQRAKGGKERRRTAVKPATVGDMRDEKRWRQTVKREVQFYTAEGEWETRFLILPTTIGKPGAGLGLFVAKEYKARQNVAVYMGQDVGDATTPLAGQSEHIMAMGGRLIDGLHGASGVQYINAACHLNTGQLHNAKFTSTGTIVTTTKIKKGQEILTEYGGELWARKARAQKWREAHPVEAEALRREAEERDVMMAQKKMTYLHKRGRQGEQRR